MIKTNLERTELQGSETILMAELSATISSFKQMLTEKHDAGTAKEMIEHAISIGLMDEEEIAKEEAKAKEIVESELRKLEVALMMLKGLGE